MTKKSKAIFFPQSNKVRIDAYSYEFHKEYLQYLFICLKIPKNATIVFKDKTIEGGIEKWQSEG